MSHEYTASNINSNNNKAYTNCAKAQDNKDEHFDWKKFKDTIMDYDLYDGN